jgi:hypothetical protein
MEFSPTVVSIAIVVTVPIALAIMTAFYASEVLDGAWRMMWQMLAVTAAADRR